MSLTKSQREDALFRASVAPEDTVKVFDAGRTYCELIHIASRCFDSLHFRWAADIFNRAADIAPTAESRDLAKRRAIRAHRAELTERRSEEEIDAQLHYQTLLDF